MNDLEKALREQKAAEQSKESVASPKTPIERLSDAELEIKAFKAEQDLDSVKQGYENLKVRESTIAEREQALADEQKALALSVGNFELDQKARLETYNKKSADYNQAFALLQTERKEAARIMEEAIKTKSEADTIIKSQTEAEKVDQEKQEAYDANMEDSIKLLRSIVKTLKRQDDAKALSLAGTLSRDLKLIDWLQYKKGSLTTLAEIIAVDCDRIVQVCEHLQDSKVDYTTVLNYLLASTEWLQSALCISWSPHDTDVVR